MKLDTTETPGGKPGVFIGRLASYRSRLTRITPEEGLEPPTRRLTAVCSTN